MRTLAKNVFIRGATVSIRNLSVEDVTPAYVAWMNDPEVVRFTESRFAEHTYESIRAFVKTCAVHPDILLLGIFENSTGLHVGNIKIGPVDRQHLIGDIGIIIGRKNFWGKGIATEAICILRDYAFIEIGLHKLTAGLYATNIGSAKAFKKANFSLEARLPAHARFADRWVDVLRFGCIKKEF